VDLGERAGERLDACERQRARRSVAVEADHVFGRDAGAPRHLGGRGSVVGDERGRRSHNRFLRIFYTSGLNSIDPGHGLRFWIDRAQHLALPVLVPCAANMALYTRFMRASMLETFGADFIRTARAKGLREGRVILRHALRNALIPVTTLVAINFGALFGGAVITETIFVLDGMGRYFINALNGGDPYPIMAWLMVTSTIVIVFNLIADLLLGFLDPRIRLE
jgi:peptide/nickel transport system permease protein